MKKCFYKLSAVLLACTMFFMCCFCVNAEENLQILDEKLNNTSNYLLTLPAPTVNSIGGEWLTIGLARNETISKEFEEEYYKNVVSYVVANGSAKLHKSKSTDNSRVILALTSIKKDVTNVAGYNLLEPLSDLNYLKKQGINGPIWALIALDSKNYEILIDENAQVQTTRENIIEYIIEKQLASGGWALSGTNPDPDMTSMAIQALAPYYDKIDNVKIAINKAINVLSENQKSDGGFASWGTVNSESIAQVIVALTSLNINPLTDERFIKNGNTLLDALMKFSVENGFSHTINGNYNQMATEQAFYSLVAINRLNNNKTSLYNMTDLTEYKLGDVNFDNLIDINDVILIQMYIAKISDFSDLQKKYADTDKNGNINIFDVTNLQFQIVGLK